ncbi:Monocarboxylate transporter 14 [Nymphon striatum]|nr:Monocarboxylate transporter 14 [Nymphon striatum]
MRDINNKYYYYYYHNWCCSAHCNNLCFLFPSFVSLFLLFLNMLSGTDPGGGSTGSGSAPATDNHFLKNNSMEFAQTTHHMDKRYSWVIAFSSAFNNFIFVGLLKSIGLFYIALYQMFGVTRGMAALICVTCSGLIHGSSIISIILLFRFGYKKQILFGVCFASFGLFLSYFGQNGTHLLLTFGIIQGFGIGISATLNIAITSQYFIKHRGKANGIIFAGCSLGACVFPPVIEYLLEKYGLKGTFLLLSGISLNTLVSTLLMKDPPTILKRRRQTNTDKKITDFDEVSSVEIIQNKDLEANSFNKGLKQNCLVEEKSSNPPISAKELVLSTLKSGYLYAIVASGQAATVALVYFYTTIPDHALSLGIGIYETAYLLSITSIADLCGRIVIGILIDKNFIQICNSYGLSLILSGTFMLAIGLCLNASFVTLTVLCCCFGIAHGSCNIHMPIMVSHYMAAEKLPIVIFALKTCEEETKMATRSNRFHRMDGGYAWVITIASMLNNVLIFGSVKSGGVYMVALNQDYAVSRDKAALIGITTFGSLFISGVFVSGFVNRFGYRPVQLVGSFVAFIGVFSSYFVRNADILIFTFGILQGVGFGICFVPNISIVSHYFKKHRAMANGIALSGGPLGSFLLPPLIEYLLVEYTLRGTHFIMAGIVLHMFVFSSLMLEPPYTPPVGLQIISGVQKNDTYEVNDTTNGGQKENDNNAQEADEKSETEILVQTETREVVPTVQFYADSENIIYKPTVEELPPTSNFFEDLTAIFKNGYTYLIIVNSAVICMTVISFHITVPYFSVSGGAELKDAAFLISMSSVADFFSRLFFGYFIDRKFISISGSYVLSCLVSTIAFLTVGIAGKTSYSALMGGSVLYGIAYGLIQIHYQIMITHYIGLRYLTISISLGAVVNSIFCFITSPISNEFMNTYGTYMGLYILCGVLYFFNGFIWAIVAFREGGTARRRVKYLPKG